MIFDSNKFIIKCMFKGKVIREKICYGSFDNAFILMNIKKEKHKKNSKVIKSMYNNVYYWSISEATK